MRTFNTNDILRLMRIRDTKTIRLKKDEEFLDADSCPNAGPSCSLVGMRHQYWGKDALIVVKGKYAYKIGTKNW